MLSSLLTSLCLAPAAPAFQLPFEATLSIRFGNAPPLMTNVVMRSAEVDVFSSGLINNVRLSITPASIATTGALVGPLPPTTWAPIDGFQGTFGLWPTATPAPLQTLARNTAGGFGGGIRVLGVVRVCLFAPVGACPGAPGADVFIPLAHATVGTGGSFYDGAVGWQGTWAGPAGGGVNLTVRGAPWTTGTVNAGGGLTAMGFAYGPLSQTGTTARAGGRLNFVTPIFISTSLPAVPLFPAIATLDVTFTADPTACDNGVDDDGDGYVDLADPVCLGDPAFTRENAQCQDGLDNDGDGAIDYDGGASIFGAPIAAIDGPCTGKPRRNSESSGGCGLGAEIAIALAWLARRACSRVARNAEA
jgi:hypothetical protein